MKTTGVHAAISALMMLAPAFASAETFEILSPPGATGAVRPTVIQNGIVGGSFRIDVNVLAFTFSRSAGYATFYLPDHRFSDDIDASGIDGSGRVYGSFTTNNRDGWSFVREPNGAIQTFAFPAAGIRYTSILDANIRGTSVGGYSVFDDNTGVLITQGFMRLGTGQIVQLRYPNSSITVATGNNDNGEIVGYTGFNGQLADQPFFRGALGPWKLFSLPPGCSPPDFFGGTIHLNNSGTAAGHCAIAPETFHGFIRSKNGELKPFKVPGSISTSVAGIADNGNVAGTYTDAEGSHAYIRRSIATYVKFDAPTAAPGFTFVTGYSANGDLVGTFEDTNHVSHAFVRYK
jgi:hypothetical protein